MQQKECLKEEKLAEAFRAFDKDGSGKISHNEIYQVLGIKDKDEQQKIDTIIGSVDTNKDGEIDLDEFISMMAKFEI